MRRRHYRGHHRTAQLHQSRGFIWAGVVAGLAGLAVATLGQLPAASPAEAGENCVDPRQTMVNGGLQTFRVADGLDRYAEEVQALTAQMDEQHVSYDPAALAVYEVPTVGGPVRYITDRASDFLVYWNWAGISHDPERGDLGPDGAPLSEGCVDVPDGSAIPMPSVTVRVDSEGHVHIYTGSGLNQALGSAYDRYQRAFDVIPLANASLPVNSDTLVSSPTQAVDATTWNYMPEAHDLVAITQEDESARWKRNTDACYAVNNESWLRQVCWHIWDQEYDSNDNYSYWQFHMEASSQPRGSRHMKKLWVEGVPMSGNAGYGAQAWDGRLPEPNSAIGGNSNTCSTNVKSLQMGTGEPILAAYGWELQYTNCEQWTPKMYEDQGHWANIWKYNDDVRTKNMRHVAFNMPVRTGVRDELPAWRLYSGTETSTTWT